MIISGILKNVLFFTSKHFQYPRTEIDIESGLIYLFHVLVDITEKAADKKLRLLRASELLKFHSFNRTKPQKKKKQIGSNISCQSLNGSRSPVVPHSTHPPFHINRFKNLKNDIFPYNININLIK